MDARSPLHGDVVVSGANGNLDWKKANPVCIQLSISATSSLEKVNFETDSSSCTMFSKC